MTIPLEAFEREADHDANSHDEHQTCPRCHALNGMVVGRFGRVEPCPCGKGASKRVLEAISEQERTNKTLGLVGAGQSIIMRDRSPTNRSENDGLAFEQT